MRWTLDNKVAQVTKGNRYIRYWYDASGNRVMKRLHGDTVDYILRDASGNELQRLVRRQNSGASPILMSREASLYGSSRLGTYQFSPNPGNDSTEKRSNGKTTYELTDHLGNVRATVSDQKTYTAITGGYTLAANVLSASDLYPYGMAINSRSFAAGTYRYGFNTQEKSSELLADHTTALYWEYDARSVLRYNSDPKPNPSWSTYSIMLGSPIWQTDYKGDTVRTNQEGFQNTKVAMEGILDGKINPIGFDKEKGVLTYDSKVDVSNYTDVQKDILGRYKTLIENSTDINLKIVDVNERLGDADGSSLREIGANGLTKTWRYQDGSMAFQNVYVARNPTKSNGKPEKSEYAGVSNIHELGGHAFLRLTRPTLKVNAHNKLVEELHEQIFLIFKIDGAIWYRRSEVPIHERVEE